jgi:hypothetical protein
MVDAVTPNPNNVTTLQRTPSTIATVSKSNTVLAQSVLDKTQAVFAAVKATTPKLQGSKPAGFSTNLPRGSLVDEIV